MIFHSPSQTRDLVLEVLRIVSCDPGAAHLDAITLAAIQDLLNYFQEEVDGPK
jgi:hypothetical protein